MKKSESTQEDDILPEYDLKALRVRKFGPDRVSFPQHGVVLAADVASVFPDTNSVNEGGRGNPVAPIQSAEANKCRTG